jgi:Spx/MgsR family transcriptional regulator
VDERHATPQHADSVDRFSHLQRGLLPVTATREVMRMIRLHGIPNCDTVRKARAWLDANGVAHEFSDFKKTPPSAELLGAWVGRLGVEQLLNRRGTTWRKLSPEIQAEAATAEGAVRLMLAHPSVIRRPVVEAGEQLWAGFDAEDYLRRLKG